MKRKTVRQALAGLLVAVLTGAAVYTYIPAASADMMIMPIRTVFQNRDRMKTIAVINTSNKEATFRITFVNQRQTENGSYKEVPEGEIGEFDLAKMLIFSPRQAFLPPNGKQAVRLSLRRPANLPDGEYHTHLKLSRMQSSGINDKPKAASPRANVFIGFAVPIILRQGKNDAAATISDFKYTQGVVGNKKSPPRVEFTLNRTGKFSTQGKVYVHWTPTGGEEREVGKKNSVNVFPELTKRKVWVDLTENISSGTFRVTYEGDDVDKGKTFDEKTFPVGG